MGKNPFSLLNKSREREIRNSGSHKLETIILDEATYVHIPPEAFSELFLHPEYEYLSGGLYVSAKKLVVTERVLDAAKKSVKNKNFTDAYIGKDYREASWQESVDLTRELGGKMMTPAEYFCALDWLKKYGPEGIVEDMTLIECEHLDCYTEGHKMTVNSTMENRYQKTSDLGRRCDSWWIDFDTGVENIGYFLPEDIEGVSGLPAKLRSLSESWLDPERFSYHFRKNDKRCMYRAWDEEDMPKRTPCLSNMISEAESWSSTKLRLCYTKEQMEKAQEATGK